MNRALLRRRPAPGLVFHSDRGTEYSAYAYRARLAAHGIVQSMNRPRELTGNAFIESFWHSLKAEVIHGQHFGSDAELRQAIARYMRHYNRHRLHSAIARRLTTNGPRREDQYMQCQLNRVNIPALNADVRRHR